MSDYEMDMMNPAKGPKEKPMKDLGTTIIDCRDKPTFKAQVWGKMAELRETIREQGEENAALRRGLDAAWKELREQGDRIKVLEEEKEQDHRLLGALLGILGVDPMELGVSAALMFPKKTNHGTGPKKTNG